MGKKQGTLSRIGKAKNRYYTHQGIPYEDLPTKVSCTKCGAKRFKWNMRPTCYHQLLCIPCTNAPTKWVPPKTKEEKLKKAREQALKRKIQEQNATPCWVNKKEIKQVYDDCPEGYTVDHIVPILNSKVSGLHVPWNLQYLTKKENSAKGNIFTTEINGKIIRSR